jgi:phosphomannomutase
MNYPCLNINLKKIVGRDPRPSGDFIKNALIAGILPSGADVLMTLQALQTASIKVFSQVVLMC